MGTREIRGAYSPRKRVQVEFGYYDRDGIFVPEATRTKQEFKDECDINVIMRRALSSGVFPPNLKVARYGDFSDVGDYQASLERVKAAEEQFAALPSRVREKFGNDAGKFLKWIGDKANLGEAAELGLLSEEATKRIVDSKKPAAAAVPAVEVKPPA